MSLFLLLLSCGNRGISLGDFSPSAEAGISGDGCHHPTVVAKCEDGWCTIPAGCFFMGSPEDELCRGKEYRETRHPVTLTRSFEIGEAEVTEAKFEALMGYNAAARVDSSDFYSAKNPYHPEGTYGPNFPVALVSWHDAAAYCTALSTQRSLTPCYRCENEGAYLRCAEAPGFSGPGIYRCSGFRLPTEAEWEYVYRAGTTTALYSGPLADCTSAQLAADAIAWYTKNSGEQLRPVKGKTPNAWGLHDLAGNVSEWCHDGEVFDLGAAPAIDPASIPQALIDPGAPFSARRMIRGGSFFGGPEQTRAAFRYAWDSRRGAFFWGIRCARTLLP